MKNEKLPSSDEARKKEEESFLSEREAREEQGISFLEEVLKLPLKGNTIAHENPILFSWSAPWSVLNKIPEQEREKEMRKVIKTLHLPLDGGAANNMLDESSKKYRS